jgi:eukaryotic-like serine/threonine-protein kinase
MLKNFKFKPINQITIILLVLLAGIITLSGCSSSRGAIARGWAGGVLADDILFVGSMKGNLVSVNATSGGLILSVPLETATPSSGFLSCGRASPAIVMYKSPVMAKDLVCVAGYNNGKVYAFGSEDLREEPRWVYPRQDTLENGYIVGGLTYDNGKLYYGTSIGKVFALDAAEGYKEWDIDLSKKIWSTPAVSGNVLYIGSFDKKLYALNTADGSTKWEFETEGAIASTPLVVGNTVYIGSFDRYMYALNADTGSLKWKFMADNWFWSRPILYGNTLFAPCLDGKVYLIDINNGEKKAEYNLESPISSSPVIVDNNIAVATQGGTIFSIKGDGTDFEMLAFLAEKEKIYADLVAGEGKIYVHSYLDNLYEVDAKSGAKREITIEIVTETDKD